MRKERGQAGREGGMDCVRITPQIWRKGRVRTKTLMVLFVCLGCYIWYGSEHPRSFYGVRVSMWLPGLYVQHQGPSNETNTEWYKINRPGTMAALTRYQGLILVGHRVRS